MERLPGIGVDYIRIRCIHDAGTDGRAKGVRGPAPPRPSITRVTVTNDTYSSPATAVAMASAWGHLTFLDLTPSALPACLPGHLPLFKLFFFCAQMFPFRFLPLFSSLPSAAWLTSRSLSAPFCYSPFRFVFRPLFSRPLEKCSS